MALSSELSMLLAKHPQKKLGSRDFWTASRSAAPSKLQNDTLTLKCRFKWREDLRKKKLPVRRKTDSHVFFTLSRLERLAHTYDVGESLA